jgi:hypothetical protein
MITTRDHTETVIARIQRDRKFAHALYAEALGAITKSIAEALGAKPRVEVAVCS